MITSICVMLGVLFIWLVILTILSVDEKELERFKKDNDNTISCLLKRIDNDNSRLSEKIHKLGTELHGNQFKLSDIFNGNVLRNMPSVLDRIEMSNQKTKELQTKLDLITQHLKIKFEVEPAKEAKLVIKK